MKIDKKLKLFSEIAMNEANEKKSEAFAQLQLDLEEACKGIRRDAQKLAEEEFKKEKYKAEQLKNKEITSATAESKKAFIDLRDSFLKEIYDTVTKRLIEFTDSEGYSTYLIDGIKKSIKKEDKATVYLTPKDMKFENEIAQATGFQVLPSEEENLGGFKLLFSDKKIMLDDTFKTKINEYKKNYNVFKIHD